MGAPLVPIPNMLKVFMKGFTDNTLTHQWGNNLHFGYSGTPPSNTVCSQLGAQVVAAWVTHIAPLCPSPTSLRSVQVTDLTSATSGEGTFLTTSPGTRGDDSIPANAAVLVSYPSALRYKGGHPRTYLYVLGNADLTGSGQWTPVTEVQNAWIAFLQQLVVVVVSGTAVQSFNSVRYKGKFLPNSGPPHFYLTTPLVNAINPTTAKVQAQMASQRRRIGRVRK